MLKNLRTWFWKDRIETALIWLRDNCYSDSTDVELSPSVVLSTNYIHKDSKTTIKILLDFKPVYELTISHRIVYSFSTSPVTELERYNFGSWVYVVWKAYEDALTEKRKQEEIVRRAKFQALDE